MDDVNQQNSSRFRSILDDKMSDYYGEPIASFNCSPASVQSSGLYRELLSRYGGQLFIVENQWGETNVYNPDRMQGRKWDSTTNCRFYADNRPAIYSKYANVRPRRVKLSITIEFAYKDDIRKLMRRLRMMYRNSIFIGDLLMAFKRLFGTNDRCVLSYGESDFHWNLNELGGIKRIIRKTNTDYSNKCIRVLFEDMYRETYDQSSTDKTICIRCNRYLIEYGEGGT